MRISKKQSPSAGDPQFHVENMQDPISIGTRKIWCEPCLLPTNRDTDRNHGLSFDGHPAEPLPFENMHEELALLPAMRENPDRFACSYDYQLQSRNNNHLASANTVDDQFNNQ